MKKTNKTTLAGIKTFDNLLDTKYGKTGTPRRSKFEKEGQYFIISEIFSTYAEKQG